MRQRYFLGLEGDQWPDGFREVSVERWIEAERTAGFHGPAGRPATGGFSGHGVVGHVHYGDGDPFLGEHQYLSTYCLHSECNNCRLTCKVCDASCQCTCHLKDQGHGSL